MTIKTENLWPDFSVEETVISPKTILEEQIQFLGKGTKNVLTANIRTETFENGEIKNIFQLVAPKLDGYKYTLFTLTQKDIRPFPCKFDGEKTFSIKNKETLIERLRVVFNSDETKEIIKILISQSMDNPKR
ncbi:hypothetical protein LV89_00774 [Arcicella aurantiaca]|uniref:Uncharacterized protein n=1 Tax=Arcicella aurantiaca TaxID=591202 RepID=A0A316EER6_9BACT|nr:hypothetical protein [Arcicella aurantiaca]PWK28570.1 hypothetical protein LV89_00774 [Arcicella aurantiaca]